MENNYSVEDIFAAISNLPKNEKEYVLKKLNINDLLITLNNRSAYCGTFKLIEDAVNEIKLMESSLTILNNELKKSNSNKIHDYANTKVLPEIDGYTFARMVDIVAEITQHALPDCSSRVYKILNRLYLIKANEFESDVELEKNKKMLEYLNVSLEGKVFWILDGIAKKWEDYSSVQQATIARSIADIRYQEVFYVLMVYWNRIDNRVSAKRVEEILNSCKEIANLVYDENKNIRLFGDVVNDIANNWFSYSQKERDSIINLFLKTEDFNMDNILKVCDATTGLVGAMKDIYEKVSEYERSKE